MKLENLFFLFAFQFQCMKGDIEILQKYQNQRIYSAQELHIKVEYYFYLCKLNMFDLGNGKADWPMLGLLWTIILRKIYVQSRFLAFPQLCLITIACYIDVGDECWRQCIIHCLCRWQLRDVVDRFEICWLILSRTSLNCHQHGVTNITVAQQGSPLKVTITTVLCFTDIKYCIYAILINDWIFHPPSHWQDYKIDEIQVNLKFFIEIVQAQETAHHISEVYQWVQP